MNNNFLVAILLLFSVSLLQGQVPVPDDNFEAYLETHDANGNEVLLGNANSLGDGMLNNDNVPLDKINNLVVLNLSNKGILALTGIEFFTSLETLICDGNKLTALDVSSNSNLKSLLCGLNQLTSLDVGANLALEVLDISGNQILTINVLGNLALERLTCSSNRLADLDVSQNSRLKYLAVSNNQLSSLEVITNTDLESLFCASNQITALDLSANTILKNLDASNNLILSLDLRNINSKPCINPQTNPVSLCQGSASVNISRNQLNSLVLNNGFNNLMASLISEDNPDLYCIVLDAGFTPPSVWVKDDWAYYGETGCTDIYTYVPDENFEGYLEANNFGDGVLDNKLVLTANISALANLSIPTNSISDLTGIEDFTALTSLDCSDNDLKTLDLSANVNLTSLICSANILPTLNLENNTALINLDCSSQSPFVDPDDASNNYTFNTLKLDANAALETLDCSNNDLINLDLSANIQLTEVDCSSNQITSLNVVLNDLLARLICNNNALTTLNVKNGTNQSTLAFFNAENNPELFCIEVDDVGFSQANANWLEDDINFYNPSCGTYVPDNAFEAYLESIGLGDGITDNNFVSTALVNAFVGPLDISNRGILDLTGIQDFLVLENLDCSINTLTHLDVSNNTALKTINCSFNQIENLNVVSNIALETLQCQENALLSLDVRNTTNNGLLTTFNASNNPNLFCINVDNVSYSTGQAGWLEDDPDFYNTDCDNSRFTSIPDPNFEQALIDLGYDDVIDTFVLTANIEQIINLDVNDKGILDLTGIQAFKLLQTLDCSSNYLSTLDVNGMINLQQLNCSSNYFLTTDATDPNIDGLLNILGTDNLIKLFCASNSLADLDISLHTNLKVIECFDNNLESLDISNNVDLKVLNTSNNNLSDLDISTNTVLEKLNCDSNQLSNLTSYNADNTTLQILSCNNNALPAIILDRYLALKTIYCRSNQLGQLILTANTALENVDFSNNAINSIDLTNNTTIISVLGSQNQLTQIDLNTNAYTFLETLNISNNQLSALPLNSPNLKYLFCSNNQLTTLDLTTNGSLITLNVSSNALATLSLSANLNQLKTFNCSNNVLVGGFDLSTMGTGLCPTVNPNNPNDFCPDTILINLSNNQLDFVNIQNGINTEISNLNTTNNPELSCIQVDDVNNIGANWLKDAATEYRFDCRFGETYVPDPAFEQALMDDPNITVDPNLDGYVPTAAIELVINLDISGKGISDLTGIADFTALQNLNCSNNTLATLDLNKNVNITEINCSNNGFSDLYFSNNVALTTIDCSNNTLGSLDVAANTNLTNLNISNNMFAIFTPGLIPTLQTFNCDVNLLLELDFQTNTALTSLSCQDNALEKLNIRNGQNPNLLNLNAQSNVDLTCIETDTGTIPGGGTWLKDPTAEFVMNCYYGQTNVPDDAFERALIALGLDIVLDDYVLTANIENRSFLNISNEGVSDLTGIEDFISLTTLNVEGNTITNADLSSNVLLRNLNASNNTLTDLDLSFLADLVSLDASNNSLNQLTFGANSNLISLNISNNVLTAIDIALLINLEVLDCSLNQLEGLDATSNPNLKELYCQTNLFIQDKLNIQNGSNQTLEKLSAIDNPDLACILVDNPFTVITNNGGVYDGWFKDVTANYQTICEDADNDGVANADDQCPSTPFGDPVDLFGCTILSLPNNNFTILITGETCLNNNNGKINISTLEYYNYTATLTGEDFSKAYHFTTEIDILNLLAGTYQMCITIDEWPGYLSCYDVIISQPEPLGVLTNKSLDGKSVSINMFGSSSYNINFNDLKFNTSESSLILSLQEGENNIKISTDVECQGVYEETIIVSDDVFTYPNPFHEKINLYTGNSDSISVKVYSYLGQLVYSNNFIGLKSNKVEVNTSSFSEGIYVITVETKSLFSTFKMVKK